MTSSKTLNNLIYMNSSHTFVANLETFVQDTNGKILGDVSVTLRSPSGSLSLDLPHAVARDLYVFLGSKLDKATRAKDPTRQPY